MKTSIFAEVNALRTATIMSKRALETQRVEINARIKEHERIIEDLEGILLHFGKYSYEGYKEKEITETEVKQ